MQSEDDAQYWQRRAHQEEERARSSPDPVAARRHAQLAQLCRRRGEVESSELH